MSLVLLTDGELITVENVGPERGNERGRVEGGRKGNGVKGTWEKW